LSKSHEILSISYGVILLTYKATNTQELSYRKQIARQLRTQHVKGI